MLRHSVFCLCLLLALTPTRAYADRLNVVATFSILGDMVARVGGEHIELTTLVGPDADSHAFEPTPAALRAMKNADLVVVNGISYEGWIGRLIVSSGYSGPVIVAARDVTALTVNDRLELDPHAWQSVSSSLRYVANIRDGLIEADRGRSAKYKENAERYSRELQALEDWIREQIGQVPEEKRVVVTSHDAFQYFGRSYGVRFLSPDGVDGASGSSAARLARIVDRMRKDHIRAVFPGNTADDSMLAQLRQDAGAVIGGTLYPDALSAPGGPAPSYIAMMRHNVSRLVEGMQRNGPSGGTPQVPGDSTLYSQ